MTTDMWFNIGLGNGGLMADGTKPFPEPMLTYYQLGSGYIHLMTISREITLKTIYLQFHSNLTGANGLINPN